MSLLGCGIDRLLASHSSFDVVVLTLGSFSDGSPKGLVVLLLFVRLDVNSRMLAPLCRFGYSQVDH